jgi:hypothetical protein
MIHLCSICNTEGESPDENLPRKWKRIGESAICGSCVSQGYATRQVVVPVIKPLEGTWDEFGKALRECWSESTAVSNLIIREVAKLDPPPTSGEKIQKFKPDTKPIYALAREQWPQFDTGALSALMQRVVKVYQATRFDVVRGSRSLPDFRYPTPYPVRAQNWQYSRGPNGEHLLSVRLGSTAADGPRGKRWTLLLKGGSEYARSIAAMKRIGEDVRQGELLLVGRRSGQGGRKVEDKPAGGGNERKAAVLARITLTMPRAAAKEGRTLQLKRDAEGLLIWVLDDRVMKLNADQAFQWIAADAEARQRMSEDMKREKRWPRRVRRNMVRRMEVRSSKRGNRMKTFCQQSAAMLAGFCARNGVAKVEYDASGGREQFPWFQLEGAIENRLTMDGVAFEKLKVTP